MVRLRAVMGLAFTPASVVNRQFVYRSWPLAAIKTDNVINPTVLRGCLPYCRMFVLRILAAAMAKFFLYFKILRVTQRGKELIFVRISIFYQLLQIFITV